MTPINPDNRVFNPSSEAEEQEALARLADGSLPEHERTAVEAYVAATPAARQALARQRRVAMALRAGGPELSPRARLELDALGEARAGTAGASRRGLFSAGIGLGGLSTGPLLGIAGVAAAAVVALVLLLGGGSGGPSIERTAELAHGAATEAAPAPNPGDPRLLQAGFGGITMPDYEPRFGIPATGQRTDALDGRKLLTVYYKLPNGHPMSYSIVSGKPLELPPGGRVARFHGIVIHGYPGRKLAFVTLVRKGRTCVLAGETTVAELVSLAKAPLESS